MDPGHNPNPLHDANTQMRDLRIDLSLLEAAMESSVSSDGRYVVDIETGDVILVADEIHQTLEQARKLLDASGSDLPRTLDAALADLDLPDWMNDAVRGANTVERNLGTRFIEIPGIESRDAYNDMAEFTESIADDRLRERFQPAIAGRGVFRRVKDALLDAPSDWSRWFEFKTHRDHARAVTWRRSIGIEPRDVGEVGTS